MSALPFFKYQALTLKVNAVSRQKSAADQTHQPLGDKPMNPNSTRQQRRQGAAQQLAFASTLLASLIGQA